MPLDIAGGFEQFEKNRSWYEAKGIITPQAKMLLPDAVRRDYRLAMDALPGLTTDPNSGVPAMLTTFIDPAVYEVLFSPNKVSEVLGENRKGDWLTDTAMFPVVEHTGEVSSYGDYNNNGRAGANTNWPQRQSYHFQTIMNYGERELERAGLARINWVSEVNQAGVDLLNRFMNLTWIYGVRNLQNYGIVNDPLLPAALTPSTKANGGVTWFTAGGTPNATANEVYNDVIAMFEALVNANSGLVDQDTKMTLALSPGSSVALTFTNSYGVNVTDLLKKNYPNISVVTIPQFGARTTQNSQGIVGGNLVQLVAESVEGQKTGFCGFTEKLRSHTIVRELSSYKQKQTSGTWGTVIRMPVGFSQMLGV